MSRPLLAIALGGMVTAAALFVWSTGRKLRPEAARPSAIALVPETVLEGSDSFAPSGITGLSNCKVMLAGAQWGTLVELNQKGDSIERIGVVPGYRKDTRLELGDSDQVLIWSSQPAYIAMLNVRLMQLDSSKVFEHRWGGHWAGPGIPLGGGSYAIAPLSDRTTPRKQPPGWKDLPLLHLVDREGNEFGAAGSIVNQGGQYLTSLRSAGTVGVFGDTLKFLSHADASIFSFLLDRSAKASQLIRQVSLPKYFKSPAAQEDVWTYPWIQFNGEKVVLQNLQHVAAAAFGSNDRVYAIRNYGGRWRSFKNRFHGRTGMWSVTSQALEVYDGDGMMLGAYTIPGITITWLRADRMGRIFLGDSMPRVFVTQDPTIGSSDRRCSRLPPKIRIDVNDMVGDQR